jgi:hypothetical protein
VVRRTLLIVTALLVLLPVTAAQAARSTKKAIAGPVELDGTSAFPIYRDLGAGIYVGTLDWAQIAAFRPSRARDPEDPSYDWPQDLDEAMSDAKDAHLQIALTLTGAPGWANGGHPARYAPKRAADFADFAVAAARRYPSVHIWVDWPGASTAPGFSATRYARLLDTMYGALKAVSGRNTVAGGGSTSANGARWIDGLKLPGGRAPRLDYYAHDPSSTHRLKASALSRIERLVQQRFHATRKLFLAGYTLPTRGAHHVSPATQASYLKTALQLARRASYVYTLAYDGVSDQDHTDGRGLLAADGTKRPAYTVFKDG